MPGVDIEPEKPLDPHLLLDNNCHDPDAVAQAATIIEGWKGR